MTKREAKAEVVNVKGLLTEDGDFVRAAVTADRQPLYMGESAASATFALNAALCFCRVRFMSCSRATRAF
jgi:hypothetical protein